MKNIDFTFTFVEKSQSFSSHSKIVPWCTNPTALKRTSTLSIDEENFSIESKFVESNFFTSIFGNSLFNDSKVLSLISVLEHLENPNKILNSISSYKLNELQNIAKKLNISLINAETSKNKNKKELYETIINNLQF